MSFQRFEAPRLLVLVGSNPLPAAVASSLLCTEDGAVTLVCTRTTRNVANKLNAWLTGCGIRCEEPLEVREADKTETQRAIFNWADTGRGRVGLNYTGGTKAMAVHVCDAVKTWTETNKAEVPVFSYLDARRLSMVFDPFPGSPTQLVEPIPAKYPMSLKHLVHMHGWRITREASTTALLPQTAEALRNIYVANDRRAKAWRKWKKDILRSQCGKYDAWDGFGWKPWQQLNDVVLDLPDELNSVWETLPSLLVTDNRLRMDAVGLQTRIGPAKLCGYFDGKWLESLVLEALIENKTQLNLRDVGSNLEIEAVNNMPGQVGVDFELDDFALHSYQLFVISCGTMIEKTGLKHKLIEAYMRAKQIGGDEARVALVCPSDIPNVLENEVRSTLGRNNRVRVFGRSHLGDLSENIRQWVELQSRAEEAG